MHPHGPIWETNVVRCFHGERASIEREWALKGWVAVEWQLGEFWDTGAPYYMLSFRRADPSWLLQARSDETAGKHADLTPKP